MLEEHTACSDPWKHAKKTVSVTWTTELRLLAVKQSSVRHCKDTVYLDVPTGMSVLCRSEKGSAILSIMAFFFFFNNFSLFLRSVSTFTFPHEHGHVWNFKTSEKRKKSGFTHLKLLDKTLTASDSSTESWQPAFGCSHLREPVIEHTRAMSSNPTCLSNTRRPAGTPRNPSSSSRCLASSQILVLRSQHKTQSCLVYTSC